MTKDKNATEDDSKPADAKAKDDSSTEKQRSQAKTDELDEGLDESFPGSDAPASTQRSSKD